MGATQKIKFYLRNSLRRPLPRPLFLAVGATAHAKTFREFAPAAAPKTEQRRKKGRKTKEARKEGTPKRKEATPYTPPHLPIDRPSGFYSYNKILRKVEVPSQNILHVRGRGSKSRIRVGGGAGRGCRRPRSM